jgi:type II secretory pathway pseudopilin PulG
VARRLTIVAVLVLGVIAAVAFWALSNRTDRAERQLGLDAARTLSETFAKARDLRVATLSGEVIARGNDPGFAQLLPTSMTVRYPYSVDYFVDLRRIDRSGYRWDAASKTMTVRLPDVVPARPNVDAGGGERIGTTGVFMSRDAAQRLNAQVAARASIRAGESSRKREHLDRARASAREAMQELVGTPLRAAGLGEVKVVVRYPWEPVGAGAAVRWDESTPLDAIGSK